MVILILDIEGHWVRLRFRCKLLFGGYSEFKSLKYTILESNVRLFLTLCKRQDKGENRDKQYLKEVRND